MARAHTPAGTLVEGVSLQLGSQQQIYLVLKHVRELSAEDREGLLLALAKGPEEHWPARALFDCMYSAQTPAREEVLRRLAGSSNVGMLFEVLKISDAASLRKKIVDRLLSSRENARVALLTQNIVWTKQEISALMEVVLPKVSSFEASLLLKSEPLRVYLSSYRSALIFALEGEPQRATIVTLVLSDGAAGEAIAKFGGPLTKKERAHLIEQASRCPHIAHDLLFPGSWEKIYASSFGFRRTVDPKLTQGERKKLAEAGAQAVFYHLCNGTRDAVPHYVAEAKSFLKEFEAIVSKDLTKKIKDVVKMFTKAA